MPDLKPMLASNVEDFKALKFPAYASPKLDGVRASMQNGRLVSRSLKPIPNVNVQAKFAGLPEGTDGELIVGQPNEDPYRRTVSVVMSDNKPVDDTGLYVFDRMGPAMFDARYSEFKSNAVIVAATDVHIVPQIVIASLADLETAETQFLEAGYEGLMYRDPNGKYKHGRSSEREAILLKVKRCLDAEAVIIGTEPEMENQNVAFTNELGRTARSSAKAGKVAKDTLGKLNARGFGGTYDMIEFDIAVSTLTHVERKQLWDDRKSLVGKVVTFIYFPIGGDVKPRHPRFKGFRDIRDLS